VQTGATDLGDAYGVYVQNFLYRAVQLVINVVEIHSDAEFEVHWLSGQLFYHGLFRSEVLLVELLGFVKNDRKSYPVIHNPGHIAKKYEVPKGPAEPDYQQIFGRLREPTKSLHQLGQRARVVNHDCSHQEYSLPS
jgi:hypothetical protein